MHVQRRHPGSQTIFTPTVIHAHLGQCGRCCGSQLLALVSGSEAKGLGTTMRDKPREHQSRSCPAHLDFLECTCYDEHIVWASLHLRTRPVVVAHVRYLAEFDLLCGSCSHLGPQARCAARPPAWQSLGGLMHVCVTSVVPHVC